MEHLPSAQFQRAAATIGHRLHGVIAELPIIGDFLLHQFILIQTSNCFLTLGLAVPWGQPAIYMHDFVYTRLKRGSPNVFRYRDRKCPCLPQYKERSSLKAFNLSQRHFVDNCLHKATCFQFADKKHSLFKLPITQQDYGLIAHFALKIYKKRPNDIDKFNKMNCITFAKLFERDANVLNRLFFPSR